MIGEKFGRLTVIGQAPSDPKSKNVRLLCKCDCGNEKVVARTQLKNNKTKSCGCFRKEKTKKLGEKNLTDETGNRFGRLIVIKKIGRYNNGNVKWLCKCDCGNETIVGSHNLRTKSILSCGCFHAEQNTVHGMSNTNLYSRWISMKKRCYNSNEKCFKDYGGRGIFVDELWRDNFKEFYDWATSNGWNPELELDRIDNNGPYSPENCRWITHQQNCINRIR